MSRSAWASLSLVCKLYPWAICTQEPAPGDRHPSRDAHDVPDGSVDRDSVDRQRMRMCTVDADAVGVRLVAAGRVGPRPGHRRHEILSAIPDAPGASLT